MSRAKYTCALTSLRDENHVNKQKSLHFEAILSIFASGLGCFGGYFKSRKDVKAFTLAEVLITLGIIGVVAAMTIPTLLKNTQDAELKTAWKKEYSVLSQAIASFKNDNGGTMEGVSFLLTPLKKYIKITKTCNDSNVASDGSNCWLTGTSDYKWANGTTISDSGNTPYGSKAVLENGVLYAARMDYPNCDNTFYGNSTIADACGIIHVDVNSFKGPNQVGKDIFGVLVTKAGLRPMGANGSINHGYYGKNSADYLLQ